MACVNLSRSAVAVNYLAHLHLSDGTPESMLGNIIADFVKGPEADALPAIVMRGVRLHRAVDSYTDRHPVVMRSIRRLGGKLGWYGGIVIDIYYDHLLARNWLFYASEPLRLFADRAYRVLADNLVYFTQGSRVLVERLIREDRLMSYASPSGIAETLERVSWRIMERMPKREVRLHDAMPDLLSADAELETDFNIFYPQLIAFAAEQKKAVAQPGLNSPPKPPAIESRVSTPLPFGEPGA